MIEFRASLVVASLFGLTTAISATILCSEPSFCQQQWGPDSHCKFSGSQGNCSCNSNYYLQGGDTPYCSQCPGVGESCVESQCCSKGLVCRQGVCFCVYINEYCWTVNDSERARFQRVAQCILAVALILTTSILFFLFWKACTRHDVVRHIGRDSFPSLNSVQHLVLMQLQDRPPPYSTDYLHNSKHPVELLDAPPSYIEAVGMQGQCNHAFSLPEYPRLNNEGGGTAINTVVPNQGISIINLSTPSDSSQGLMTSTSNISNPEETPPLQSHTDCTNGDFVNTQNNLNRQVTLHI